MQLLVIRGNGTTASALSLKPAYLDTDAASAIPVYWLQSNDQVFAYAAAGQHFQAYAQLAEGAFNTFACAISGEMLP